MAWERLLSGFSPEARQVGHRAGGGETGVLDKAGPHREGSKGAKLASH